MTATSDVTIVLVHGAGHTSRVWDATRAALAHPSLAVDLPGRGARPGDITRVTVAAAGDVRAAVGSDAGRDLVLAGHSVAGTVLPSAAALLGGRVVHLVFVAGISAPEGELPLDVFLPDRAAAATEHLAELRAAHRGRSLEALDTRVASSIDSLNLSSQPMRWAGIPATLPRTFVRCRRDPIQPRALQDRFIANCGATDVVDIDTGHTPALEAPALLAAALDRIGKAARVTRP